MYIIIEHCSDGSYEPVSYLGAYESLEDAREAMLDRMHDVSETYLCWREIDFWDATYVTSDSASCALEGEGSVFTWYIFDVDKPYDINGYV